MALEACRWRGETNIGLRRQFRLLEQQLNRVCNARASVHPKSEHSKVSVGASISISIIYSDKSSVSFVDVLRAVDVFAFRVCNVRRQCLVPKKQNNHPIARASLGKVTKVSK